MSHSASQGEERRGKAKQAELLVTTVRSRKRISPSFARLTLGGGDLSALPRHGYDHWFRLFMPRAGHEGTDLPAAGPDPLWYSRYLATPDEERPRMRYVTVREHRLAGPEGPEIDVDVVVHGEPGQADCGPLSTWAQTAEPGKRVGLIDQGPLFKPDLAANGVWLVGDETALPAFAGILASLPAATRGRVTVEVPDEGDVQELTKPAGIDVEWLPRRNVTEVPGDLALAAVRMGSNGARPYVYAAGESVMTASLGRLLLQGLAWPKELVHTVGYWHYSPTSGT